MPRKRRSYPAELKAKVALEALREEAPMAELAARYGVHPHLIANWKTKARQQVLAGCSGNHERQEASREAEIQQLRAKIGELVIERDFLSKAFGRCATAEESGGLIPPTHGSVSCGSVASCPWPARRSTTRARARVR